MLSRKTAAPLLVMLLALLAPVLAPGAEGAQPAIHESVDVPFVDGPTIFKNQDLAQSFTATANYQLVRVEAMLHDLDPTQPVDPLNLTIASDAGGVPNGTALATGTADGGFGYDWLAFDLNSVIDLTAGAVYWIVLEDKIMIQGSGYKWGLKPGDTYPGGSYAVRSGGGPWSPMVTDDLLFRTWGLTGPLVVAGIQVDSSTAAPYDPLTYSVYFNNTGTQAASYVWANVTLSPNTTYQSDTAAASGGTTLGPTAWQFTDVGIGPHEFQVRVAVNQDVFDGLRMETTAQLEYANETEVLQERTSATAVTIARAPSLQVTKAVTPRFLGLDENLTYTITLVNSGSRPSPWVFVNDTLPTEVVYIGNTASSLANYTSDWFDGTTLRVNFTNLSPGPFVFDINVRTRAGLINGTTITNTVNVDFADSRGVRATPSASATATARIDGASIQVSKSANVAIAGPGQEVRYRIRYDNRGNAIARSVWINDTLPSQVDYVSDTGGGAVSGSAVRFIFSNVTVGTHSLTLVARVQNATTDGTVLVNAVTLSHTDSDGAMTPASASSAAVLVARPSILLSATAPATADPGDLWDLMLTIWNRGNASADAVWLNVTKPPELTEVSNDAGSQGGIATATGWYFTDVAPGTFSFRLTLQVPVGLVDGTTMGVVVSGAFVDALDRVSEPPPTSVSLKVVSPVMGLSLGLSRSSVGVGETVVLSIDYANIGAGVAAVAWINVSVPSGVTVVSASEAWTATTGLTFTWKVADLASGNRQLRITLRPDSELSPGGRSIGAVLEYTDANENPRPYVAAVLTLQVVNVGWSAGTLAFFLLLAAVASLSGFIGWKVYGLGAGDRAQVQQLFLLHKSGLLIKHYTRHLHGSLDTDILAAMIVAVQNFVRESFRFRAGDLEEMKFGPHKILLVHGHHAILAAVVSGSRIDRLKTVLKVGVERMEAQFGSDLTDWSGVVDDFKGLDELLDQILRGKTPYLNGAARAGMRNGNGGL